jgi:hypothetical protein
MKRSTQNKALRIISSILLATVIILILGLTKSCNANKQQLAKIQTLEALQDTPVVMIVTDTFIQWKKETITLHPKEISKQGISVKDTITKKFLQELENQKALVAATQMQLIKRDSLILSFLNKKDTAVIEINDTLANLSYSCKVKIDDTISIKLDYRYKLDIRTKTIKEKDKFITYLTIDDPKVDLKSANFLVIPFPKEKKVKKIGRWIGGTLGSGISLGLGYYVGSRLN